MNRLKIYLDINYPLPVVKTLEDIHDLQKIKKYEIVRWQNEEISSADLKDSIFLLVDYQKHGLSIPIIKQAGDGYKTIVCRVNGKIDRFEFMITVLRVWPSILENKEQLDFRTILTFPYGGRRLKRYKI